MKVTKTADDSIVVQLSAAEAHQVELVSAIAAIVLHKAHPRETHRALAELIAFVKTREPGTFAARDVPIE